MQCGTSHLQTVQENMLSHIILATYRKFTVATVRFKWQMLLCKIIHQTTKATEYIYTPITALVAPRTLTWQSLDLVQYHLETDSLVFAAILALPFTEFPIDDRGVRCSSMVRAFAHGAMDRRIDPSWWTH